MGGIPPGFYVARPPDHHRYSLHKGAIWVKLEISEDSENGGTVILVLSKADGSESADPIPVIHLNNRASPRL